MYWNGKIKRDAHALARFILRLRETSIGMTFDQFAEFCRNQGFETVEHKQDFREQQAGERSLSFTDGKSCWEEAEFVYRVTSATGVSGQPELSFIAEGHGRFFAISIYWSGIPFRVDLSAIIDRKEIGRDAKRLFTEMLSIPGFKKFPAPGDWRGWMED